MEAGNTPARFRLDQRHCALEGIRHRLPRLKSARDAGNSKGYAPSYIKNLLTEGAPGAAQNNLWMGLPARRGAVSEGKWVNALAGRTLNCG
jgi:hypothetical protein